MNYIDMGLDKTKRPIWFKVDALTVALATELTKASPRLIRWYCRNVDGFAEKVGNRYIINPRKFDFFYNRGKFEPDI